MPIAVVGLEVISTLSFPWNIYQILWVHLRNSAAHYGENSQNFVAYHGLPFEE